MTVSPASRPRLVLAFLAAGVLLWAAVLWAGDNGSMPVRPINALQLKLLGLATVALLIGKVRKTIYAAMDRVRHPSAASRRRTAIAVTLSAGLYLFDTAIYQQRDFFPKLHDEHMHLIQMQLLAQGKLSLPAHAHADFFETFHVFNTPLYAPMHFPGTSLLYAPAVWLHLPTWLPPLCVAAVIVGLIYLLLTELIDGVAGLLGALILVSLAPFRYVSLMIVSNPVAMLFGLAMVWSWLRWRTRHEMKWAIAIGVFSGLAAITRPPDALCFAIPLGIAILIDGWKSLPAPSSIRPFLRSSLLTSGAILSGAAPFLTLQLSFDRQVTGHWLRTPHDEYSKRYNPGVNYGLREPDLIREPNTTLPQKQIYYTTFVKPFIELHRPDQIGNILLHRWLPTAVRTALPSAALLVLLPLGLLGLTDRRRAVVAAILPLGLGFYALSVMISWYYLLFTVPAVLLCVLLGARQIELAWPRAREWTAPALALMIAAFALAALPEARGEAIDQFIAPTLKAVNEKLRDIQESALVLFTFHPGDNFHEEPVYNIGVANPDDAPIIHAHDLGPRNQELFRYYGALQPKRTVYRFDRQTKTLERLGNVSDLANESTASTDAP